MNIEESSNSMQQFHATLSKSKNIIVLAGAGLSAASGIPTFRGAGGLWRQFDAMSLATPEAFRDNPSRILSVALETLHNLFMVIRPRSPSEVGLFLGNSGSELHRASQAQPNAAHRILAQCLVGHYPAAISPGARFCVVTQNVDGLSRVALESQQISGKNAMFEMHGSIWRSRCTSCNKERDHLAMPTCRALDGTELYDLSHGEEPEIAVKDLPHCTECVGQNKTEYDGLLRPAVVWFGEVPLHLDQIDHLVASCDLLLVVGTSNTVYPAAAIAGRVSAKGGKVAIFNLDRSGGDREADFLFLGPCEKTLPEVLMQTNGEN